MSEIAEFTVGEWDIELTVEYTPHYDRRDDWRSGVWNPMCLVEVDIDDVTATIEHMNLLDNEYRKMDYDKLKEKHKEEILLNVYRIEEL